MPGRLLVVVGFLVGVTRPQRLTKMSCPNSCSGHGLCDVFQRCLCADGFMAADCSQRTCPFGTAWADEPDAFAGTDQAHVKAECSNKGLCDRNVGECSCQPGFEGAACDRRRCQNSCSNRGVCHSLEFFASRADPGGGTVHEYTDVWDSSMMHGCVCFSHNRELYSGHDCSVAECPTGDDPLTTVGQHNEIQQITCEASAGTTSLSFKNSVTRPLAWDSTRAELLTALLELPTISAHAGDEAFVDEVGLLPEPLNAQASKGSIGVDIASSVDSWCGEPGIQTLIRFYQDFGQQPLLVANSTLLERRSPPGTPGKISVVKITVGSKENDVCSNRGICNRVSGQCECDQESWGSSDGYGLPGSRGDCGNALKSIADCPGEVPCSGHGKCADYPTFRCDCQRGWSGSDCSEMTCPRGKSWFQRPTATNTAHNTEAECSDMGICDPITGLCACATGFSGSACEYMACPTDAGGIECGGHGECKTMSQLALAAEFDGLNAGYTYGEDPNNPHTWDHEMVRGCHCDTGKHASVSFALTCFSTLLISPLFRAGFSGYDCSLRLCVSGDDPITPEIEFAECSNRGICDRKSGVCECFSGFGASDGQGHKGIFGDCGYVLPLLPPSSAEEDIASGVFSLSAL